MRPYLDAGFFLTLLVRTDGTPVATHLLRQVDAPCLITLLHEVQARTFLALNERSNDSSRRKAAQSGLALWQWYLDEGFISVSDVDWAAALSGAVRLITQSSDAPPPPLLLLHPILATYAGATHFLSFDPRSRSIARIIGLQILPDKL